MANQASWLAGWLPSEDSNIALSFFYCRLCELLARVSPSQAEPSPLQYDDDHESLAQGELEASILLAANFFWLSSRAKQTDF